MECGKIVNLREVEFGAVTKRRIHLIELFFSVRAFSKNYAYITCNFYFNTLFIYSLRPHTHSCVRFIQAPMAYRYCTEHRLKYVRHAPQEGAHTFSGVTLAEVRTRHD